MKIEQRFDWNNENKEYIHFNGKYINVYTMMILENCG